MNESLFVELCEETDSLVRKVKLQCMNYIRRLSSGGRQTGHLEGLDRWRIES